jgi:uncharacterized OB-fold protein
MTTLARPKPIPVPDAASEPFFAGARRGELMLLRCGVCGTYQSPTAYLGVPLRPRCVRCFAAALEWTPSSGTATLYSFALMHKVYDEAFAADVPYNVAVVETEEGVRLTSQVVDADALEIGMPLEVTFELLDQDVAIPKFRPRR